MKKLAIIISAATLLISGTAYAGQVLLQTGKTTTVRAPNNNGLNGYYSFEDATGLNVSDFSGMNKNGTLTGGPTWVYGKRGYAVSLDGTDDYVASTLDGYDGGSGTVSWWQYQTTAFNAGTIRGMWGSPSGGLFSCQVYSDNNWYCGWYAVGNDVRVTFVASATNLPQNQWSFYTLTWSAAGTTLYRNGSSIGTNGGSPTVAGDGFLQIGRYANLSATSFPGILDEFRLYNRVLSSTEITNLYNSSQSRINAPSNLNLVGYFSLEDATGTQATDFSGMSNTASLSGMSAPSTASSGWNPAKFGNGLTFDGSNDYVSIPDMISYHFGTGNFTLSTWFKTSTASDITFLSKRDVVGTEDWFLGSISITGIDTFLFYSFHSTSDICVSNSLSFRDGRWHNLTVTRSGASTLTFYLDGVAQGTCPTVNFDGLYSNPILVGRDIGLGDYLTGQEDDIRIYTRALSATEVSNLVTNAR